MNPVQDGWHTLRPRAAVDAADPIGSLDVSVLQDRLLTPVLNIGDVRTDKRIDFVGGARGTVALEHVTVVLGVMHDAECCGHESTLVP